MNNKGMTLVELMAVIAIIGLLAVLITPGIIAMRNSVLKNTLKSKITMIDNAAKDYAEEHIMQVPNIVTKPTDSYVLDKTSKDDCLIRYVRVLISDGYLSGDSNDKRDLLNPVTGVSLNDEEVCMRYDTNDPLNRKIITYIIGEDGLLE